MRILRLTQTGEGQGGRVEVSLEGVGARQTTTARFSFALAPLDQEELRWYLEDFLEGPADGVTRQLARRVQRRLAELGMELFRAVFESSEETRELWTTVRPRLADTRVEVVTDIEGATALPWELLRDPSTEAPLALGARSFVRSHPQAAQAPRLPKRDAPVIRLLLVICRPGALDVPFRSVANHLVRLGLTTGEALDLDVLRPPTFSELRRALDAAKRQGAPYEVVHFDGHGIHVDVSRDDELAEVLGVVAPTRAASVLSPPRPGAHGYLLFEDPVVAGNLQLVDGPALGRLLAETGACVLTLNACRSAHAEALPAPEASGLDPHSQVRAYGSLALEVMDAGAAGVVAMSYNVYIVAATQFVGELYAALLRGEELGAAATLARKDLAAQPIRDLGGPEPMQDWWVPVVYEAAPLRLVARQPGPDRVRIEVESSKVLSGRGAFDARLPPPPDAGFVGRDEILLAADRALDHEPIVLLIGEPRSGKTVTAAEFGRWYARTGGVERVLFSKLADETTLPCVLEDLADAFSQTLEQHGVRWLSLRDAQRLRVARQVLRQVSVLWIWDWVGSSHHPPEASSASTANDHDRLLDFLRTVRETRAKVLVTSRTDECWLGELPVRINLPSMPMRDRLLLARAITVKHGQRFGQTEDWRELLTVAGGNPQAITELVTNAISGGLSSGAIDALAAQSRARRSTASGT